MSEQSLQLAELRSSVVITGEACRALQEADYWPKRAACVVWRPLESQPRVGLGREPLTQGLNKARLADAGLAGEQHDLPLPFSRPSPAREQQGKLLLAVDQRRHAGGP